MVREMKVVLKSVAVCLCLVLVSEIARVDAVDVPVAADFDHKVTDEVTQKQIMKFFGQTPLHFVANNGQMANEVIYYAKSEGATVFCTEEGLVFGFPEGSIGLKFSEGIRVRPEAKDKLPGKVNCFIGNDASLWQTNIPTFGKVIYSEVYKGIDLVYNGDQRRLKYTFYIQPGADPDQIEMIYEGVENITLDEKTGELIIQTEWGEMRDDAPVAYQEIGGVRKVVEISFKAMDTNRVAFYIGDYDENIMLVLDPKYSTYLGGGGGLEEVGDIAVDDLNNAYIAGFTNSTDFPILNAYDSTPDKANAYVTMFSSDGTLIYSTYLGGGVTLAFGVAVDNSYNAYIVGETSDNDFPTVNAYQDAFGGGDYDAFVAKLSNDGILVYSTYLGGSLHDSASDVALDDSSNAYVVGYTSSTDFPTVNAYDSSGGSGFITKLSSSGTPVFSTYFYTVKCVAVDGLGNAYVAGTTASTDFPTVSAYDSSFNGDRDAFISKFSCDGDVLIYSTYLGGDGEEGAHGIALDSSNNAYVAGYTSSANFPTINAYDSSLDGDYAAFVTKFSSSGDTLLYSTYLGGSNTSAYDIADDIAVDKSNRAYITGYTRSADFPTINPYQPSYGGGPTDAFMALLSSGGNALLCSTYLGGVEKDFGQGIAIDSLNNVYIAGDTLSDNFPTVNAYDDNLSGDGDAFVTSFSSSITLTSPNGGNFWSGNSSYPIEWNDGWILAGDHIHLLYSTDSGNTYPNLIHTAEDCQSRSYEWVLPDINSDTVRVKIVAESSDDLIVAEDESDADFTIDSAAPETNITNLDGTQGENGWYTSNVTVTLSASDNLSGVKETKYKINDGSWEIYNEPFVITGSTVYYQSEDNAGNLETEQNQEIKIDKTAPSIPVVTDDGDYTASTTQLHAWWIVSEDAESGVVEYQYAIGTTPGGTGTQDWTSAGLNTDITAEGLSLTGWQTYYFSVQAKNEAGLWSDAGVSDGIIVNEPPVVELPDNVNFGEDLADSSIDLDDYVDDPDNTDSEMDWAYSGNTNIYVEISPTTNVVTFTALENWFGSEVITFTATDPGEASDDDSVTVTVEPMQILHFYPGWNFFSICLDIADTNLLSVLADIDGYYTSIWSYKGDSKSWLKYDTTAPDFLNNLHTIEYGNGYWIEITDEVVLVITGDEIIDTGILLYEDWNMVGWNCRTSQSRTEALESVDYRALWTYDNQEKIWLRFVEGSPDFLNTLDQFDEGNAYWIDVETGTTWTISP